MENAEVDRLVMKPTARRRLGKYVLLGRLGHGGMGKIYLAYAPGPAGIEKLLVVKRLHGHLTGDPVLVASFLDEARLSMALNHPHIGHTYDVGEVDGRFFMVMEYIEGQTLGVLLRTAKRGGVYPPSTLWASLFLQVLDGLHAAHIAKDARGRPLEIIHRDVSPQNILVTYEGLPKLVDFGIAKAAMRVSETDAGVLKGKYAYMSPEQVRGEPLDPRSDVFAAGIVLWEMLAGRRLYKAETIVRSVERILTEAVISPVRVNAECDPEIAKVAFKALQKDRNQRFASAMEFKEALEDAMEGALRNRGMKRAKQGDVRDLMHRLFGDVIDKQRAVLETCLSQADQAPAGDDDDDRHDRQDHKDQGDPSDHKKRASDSESDVSGLKLRDKSEVTTPSAVRASPLVTAEGERAADEANKPENRQTSLDRLDRGERKKPAPLSPETPTGATATAGSRPRERPPVFVIAALAVVVLLGLVAIAVVWTKREPEKIARVDAWVAPAPMPAPAPVPVPAPVPAAIAFGPEAPSSPAIPIVAPGAHEPRMAPDAHKVAAKHGKVDKRDEKPTGDDDNKPAALDKAPEMGTLSLDTVPWTVVYLGKKKLGETPLVKVPVPAGALDLLLVNPDDNVREQYIANVKPGAEFRARLDLH